MKISKSFVCKTSGINTLIERAFVLAILAISFVTLLIGLYLNKYDTELKQRVSVQKIHKALAQLIVPSLVISDISEVKHLLHMVSTEDELFLLLDSDGQLIMSDYAKTIYSRFVMDNYKNINCNSPAGYQSIERAKAFVNCSILYQDYPAKNKVGILLSFSKYKWFAFSSIIFYSLFIFIFLFSLLIMLLRRRLHHYVLKPLITLKNIISDLPIHDRLESFKLECISNAPLEICEIKEAFERLLTNLNDEYNKHVETDKMKALFDLAASVAHDIRSPLVALDLVVNNINSIPENQRMLIRNSTARIHDIANNLLVQYRQNNNVQETLKNNVKDELIADIIINLISEKKVQHKNNNIKYIINIDRDAHCLFARIPNSSLQRVLSNLIENSIDALSSEILITISREKISSDNNIYIKLQDNGSGISPDILTKILNKERATTKQQGHGLGLSTASQIICAEMNGKFDISSVVGQGTAISIIIPHITSPSWFVSSLNIASENRIIIVDDDESIHEVWKARFENVNVSDFIIYHSPSDLVSSYHLNKAEPCIFFIDYEFIGFDLNGLDVIEKLQIAESSYLVTSKYEDLQIRSRCAQINLKIIPKNYAMHIPIFQNTE